MKKKLFLVTLIMPLIVACNFTGVSFHGESFVPGGVSPIPTSDTSTSGVVPGSGSIVPPTPSGSTSISTSTSIKPSTSTSTSTSVSPTPTTNEAKDIMEASVLLSTAVARRQSSVSIKFAFNNTISKTSFLEDYIELDEHSTINATSYSTGSNKTNRFSISVTDNFATKKTTQTRYKELVNAAAAMRKSKYSSRSENPTLPIDYYSETITIHNSEELWFAASHGFKPVFENTTSNAYKCWVAARNVCATVLSDEMTQYEKYRQIYEWVCENTTYDYAVLDASDDWTRYQAYFVEGVFLNQIAVCDGFSKAINLLCGIEGIQVRRGFGYTNNNEGHAWNHMYIDGKWYLTCATWGQFDCTDESTGTAGSGIYQMFGTETTFTSYEAFLTKWDYFKDYGDCDFNEKIWSLDKNNTQVTDIFQRETYEGGDFDIGSQNEMKTLVSKIREANVNDDFCFSFAATSISSASTSTFKTWFGSALSDAGYSTTSYNVYKTFDESGYITYFTAVANI